MRPAVALSIVMLTACSRASAPVAMVDSETQKAGADALAVFIDSWNRATTGDAQGPVLYGTLYWPDAELVDPSGIVWQGQPAVVQMHVDLWNAPFKGSVLKGTLRRTRRLSPTLMIADFDLELALAGAAAARGPIKARLKHVMEKRGGEWKVIASQNTFVGPPPPSG